MIVDCIADLHGHYPKLPGGDLLIIAGDLTARDTPDEYTLFMEWLVKQKYFSTILIAGNHDNEIEKGIDFDFPNLGIEYLENSGTEFEGVKFWGTPHSLLFDGVNPKCTAFMGTEEELDVKYSHIPNDIDVIISHTPPYGILDWNASNQFCGSKSLINALARVKPAYIVCGHIHEAGGNRLDLEIGISIINCSHVDHRYKPVHDAMRIIL